MRLFETIDQIKRYVENLDAGREHAQVLHEQISENLNQKINRNMYLLLAFFAVFLLAIFHRLQWLRPLQRSSPAAQEDSAPY
jgi:type II secretory pathway component PulM